MYGRIKRHGGLLIWDTVMRKGEKRQFIFKEAVDRKDLDSCALYVDGLFHFTDVDGNFIADRTPGTFTLDRPHDIQPGIYWQEAMVDGSRWFCVKAERDGEIFQREKVELKLQGDECHLLPGQAFLVCWGSVSSTNGVLRTTTHHRIRDYIAGSQFGLRLKALEPGTMGIVLWR